MNVGCLTFATDQGIGILAKSFFDHGIITHPYVIQHHCRPTHTEWYPGAPLTNDLRNDTARILRWVTDAKLNVLFQIESPFLWHLFVHCRDVGVKSVLMLMHECSHQHLASEPDLFLAPSLLEQRIYERKGSVYIPIPVEVPWRLRTKAEVFIHNAGHGGLRGRNGTRELIEALRYIKTDPQIILRAQDLYLLAGIQAPPNRLRFHVEVGTFPYRSIFATCDVFVFPDKFSGQSCPLEEAYAAGMLVMGSDRFPHNTYLPVPPLIPVRGTHPAQIAKAFNRFDEAEIDPEDIAAKIDEWYGKDVSSFSRKGREWAESNSWKELGREYTKLLDYVKTAGRVR